MTNRYIVSNYGRVYDLFRNVFLPYTLNRGKTGYCKLKLACWQNCQKLGSKDFYIHRLVMMTFAYFPGCENYEVNHKNFNTEDNRYPANLEWVTSLENIQHNLMNKDKGTSNFTFTNDEIENICRLFEKGYTINQVADMYGGKKELISRIYHRRAYTHISNKYNIGEKIDRSYIHSEANIKLVNEICRRLERGDRIVDIANDLKVDRSVINGIKSGSNYRDISCNYNIPEVNSPIDKSIIENICKLIESGYTDEDIEKMTSINTQIIHGIRARRHYKDISSKYNWNYEVHERTESLSEDVVKIICRMLQDGKSCADVANMVGVKYHVVVNIHCRNTFTNISKDYNW